MTARKRHNPARAAAAGLASLARSYVDDSIAPAADKELLRLAAEALPFDVEVLIAAIERSYPGDSRAASMARAGVITRLVSALRNAATIANGHYDSLASKAILNGLRGKALRDGKARKSKTPQLVQDIINHKWKFKLAKGAPCAKKVAKALGYDVTQSGYSLSNIRRAIETVFKLSSQ
jgi:hypothetical protein